MSGNAANLAHREVHIETRAEVQACLGFPMRCNAIKGGPYLFCLGSASLMDARPKVQPTAR